MKANDPPCQSLALPFFCSSLFLAASSLCFLITASRAKSARAWSVLPSSWSFLCRAALRCLAISSLKTTNNGIVSQNLSFVNNKYSVSAQCLKLECSLIQLGQNKHNFIFLSQQKVLSTNTHHYTVKWHSVLVLNFVWYIPVFIFSYEIE